MLSIAIVGNCTSLGGCRKEKENKRQSPLHQNLPRKFSELGPRVGPSAGGKLGAPGGGSRPRCLPAASICCLFQRQLRFRANFLSLLPTNPDCTAAIMESLSETPWDIVVCGTGLQQSLLAL